MSALLAGPPYRERDEAAFLAEMNALTWHHLEHCREYRAVWPDWGGAATVEDLPFLHVGDFKHVDFITRRDGLRHGRVLKSSATSSGISSRIALDQESSERQARSTIAILGDFLGTQRRPLLILDNVASLRVRGELSARVSAAMGLNPLATETHFLLANANDPASLRWDLVAEMASRNAQLLVYGFTWILWQAWAAADLPEQVRALLTSRTIHFVHSGGWKRLEALRVDQAVFDHRLLATAGPDSQVVDFYGLVEQNGVIFPLCREGFRHVPAWADAVVRDPFTGRPLRDEAGQLQLLNTLPLGGPYHSVLTEDMGVLVEGDCPCGRGGRRFQLLGRMPKAETRGCANV